MTELLSPIQHTTKNRPKRLNRITFPTFINAPNCGASVSIQEDNSSRQSLPFWKSIVTKQRLNSIKLFGAICTFDRP